MSRITKQIAESTALALVKGKYSKLSKKETEFKQMIEELLLNKIPEDVLKFFKKYPNYTETSNTVVLSGNGWNFERIALKNEIPAIHGGQIQYLPEPETAVKLLSLFNGHKDLKKQIERLKKDLEITIFNLRTYKSVQENFPEAFELLPKIVNNSVQLNLSDIRNRIKE
ncbi:MAG: hypothetical protein B7Y83_00090 [Flavobacteriales bacterium 32-34-25]|nr:MAG: hypothetical protein B7Y83_00090 [Flavobacteriales bacterium 32-34-25]